MGKALPILTAALLLGVAAQAHARALQVRVLVDPSGTFDSVPGVIGISFYVAGDICAELNGPDCTPIGRFHCWGWQTDPGSPDNVVVVSQEFNFFDHGKLQFQGVEDTGPRAVTGGTGAFRNVRGEATGFDFALPEFTTTFRLHGARRRVVGSQ